MWTCLPDFVFEVAVLCCWDHTLLWGRFAWHFRWMQLWITYNLRKAQSLSTSRRASVQSITSNSDSYVQNTHSQPLLHYRSVLAPLPLTPQCSRVLCLLSQPPSPSGSWHLIFPFPLHHSPFFFLNLPRENLLIGVYFSQQEIYRVHAS